MALKRLLPRRGSLVFTFGVSAFIATVVVGFAMRHFAAAVIRDRAVADAHEAAQQLTFRIQGAVAADSRYARDPERQLRHVVREPLVPGYGPPSPTRATVAGPYTPTGN